MTKVKKIDFVPRYMISLLEREFQDFQTAVLAPKETDNTVLLKAVEQRFDEIPFQPATIGKYQKLLPESDAADSIEHLLDGRFVNPAISLLRAVASDKQLNQDILKAQGSIDDGDHFHNNEGNFNAVERRARRIIKAYAKHLLSEKETEQEVVGAVAVR